MNRRPDLCAADSTNGDRGWRNRLKNQKDRSVRVRQSGPTLATHGTVAGLKASQWAFEVRDGYQLLAEADHGAVRWSRSGRDVTAPSIRTAGYLREDLADHHVVLTARPSHLTPLVCPASARCTGPRQ